MYTHKVTRVTSIDKRIRITQRKKKCIPFHLKFRPVATNFLIYFSRVEPQHSQKRGSTFAFFVHIHLSSYLILVHAHKYRYFCPLQLQQLGWYFFSWKSCIHSRQLFLVKKYTWQDFFSWISRCMCTACLIKAKRVVVVVPGTESKFRSKIMFSYGYDYYVCCVCCTPFFASSQFSATFFGRLSHHRHVQEVGWKDPFLWWWQRSAFAAAAGAR